MQEEIPEDKLAELQETLSNAADAASEVTELQDEASKAAEEAARRAAESADISAGGAADETDPLTAAQQFAEKQADLEKAQTDLEDDRHELQITLGEATATGRASAQPPAVSDDRDGVFNGGDRLYVEGDFAIVPGSSVTFEDADGTRGTVTDGRNASIVEGSIDRSVTGAPTDMLGGDGQLATDGLGIVDTTGMAASPEFSIGFDAFGGAGLQYDRMIGTYWDPVRSELRYVRAPVRSHDWDSGA